MKILWAPGVIVLIMVAFNPLHAEENEGPSDFRQVRWGASPEAVRKTEAADRQTGALPGLLLYEGEIAGVRASIFYYFDGDTLARGIYTVETLDQGTVMNDYEKIRGYMLKEYGEPSEERLNLKEEAVGDLDPAAPGDRYQLVLRQAMSPETIWETGHTRIYLQLTEKDGRVAIEIDYFPSDSPVLRTAS